MKKANTPSPRKFTRDELNGLIDWLTDEQGFYKFERIIKEARANPTKYRTDPKYRVRKADGPTRKPQRKTSGRQSPKSKTK